MSDDFVAGFKDALGKMKTLLEAAKDDAFVNSNLSEEQHDAVYAQLDSLIEIVDEQIAELN